MRLVNVSQLNVSRSSFSYIFTVASAEKHTIRELPQHSISLKTQLVPVDLIRTFNGKYGIIPSHQGSQTGVFLVPVKTPDK